MLAAALVAHVWFVDVVRDARGAFDHDEVITHLDVSGHLDDWHGVIAGDPPRGTWTSGADFQRFLELDDDSSFGEVRANLTDYDIHPPLYFWAVYVARSAGLGLYRSGPAVNLVASVLTGALLYVMVRNVMRRRVLAAIAVAGFAVSPALVYSVSLARQYVFLTLATTALLWATARLLEHPRSPAFLACLAAATACGLLTATQFAYSLVGALVLLAMVAIRRRDLGAVVAPAGAAVAGGLAALALHPGFGVQLSRLDDRRSGFATTSVSDRLGKVLSGTFDLISMEDGADRVLTPLVLLLVVALLATFPRWRRPARDALGRSSELLAAVGIGGVTLVLIVLAYTAGRVPPHTVGRHYVVVLLPPLIVVAAAVAARAPRPGVAIVAGVAIIGVCAWHWTGVYESNWRHQRRAVGVVSNAALAVADCPLAGFAPGAAMWLPRDANVLLTPADDGPYPPLPGAAVASPAVLFHGRPGQCGRIDDAAVDRRLAGLGLVRGEFVGDIGKLQIFRLDQIDAKDLPVEPNA